MKIAIVTIGEITKHPTMVMSAEYWVNIKAGLLPFSEVGGKYVCSHTKNLNKAIYLTEAKANELNIAIGELKKAKELVEQLKNQPK